MSRQTTIASWKRRKLRVRKKVNGTVERPRMTVFKSNKHIYAQVIDDVTGTTLAAASTQSAEIREQAAGVKKTEAAALVGGAIGLVISTAAILGVGAIFFPGDEDAHLSTRATPPPQTSTATPMWVQHSPISSSSEDDGRRRACSKAI